MKSGELGHMSHMFVQSCFFVNQTLLSVYWTLNFINCELVISQVIEMKIIGSRFPFVQIVPCSSPVVINVERQIYVFWSWIQLTPDFYHGH